jgi:hypothetical protein
MSFSRREFGRMALSSLALSPLGLRPALASPASSERKFLFIFARGGWDYSYVFAPLFDNSWVYTDPGSTAAEAHGVPYVDAYSRPAVREFFENYGDRACIINGMEVRSITHAVCTRLMFTGNRSPADDFGSILAAHSNQDLVLPHAILSGPSYGYQYSSQVVRMGSDGQLATLLDGNCLNQMDLATGLPGAEAEDLVQAYIRGRSDAVAAEEKPGWAGRVGGLHAETLDHLSQLEAGSVDMSLDLSGMSGQVTHAVSLLGQGLSRCVTIQHDGFYDLGWDSHSTNSFQDSHFQLYFEAVNQAMAELDATTSLSGNPLSDEVTVVLISEMGRDPRLNAQEGKHHWTHTSAMVVGSGIQGGQVVGAFDENVASSPVDLVSGEVHSQGSYLLPSHLGATLLALGDVDPEAWLEDAQPIEAMLK